MKQARGKILFFAFLLLFAAGSVLGWRFFSIDSGLKAEVAGGGKSSFRSTSTYVVEKGDTWSGVAEKAGLGGAVADILLKTADGIYDLSSIRAGNAFYFFFENNEFYKLHYDIDDEYYLKIRRMEEGRYAAQKIKIPYAVDEVSREGIIESSLFQTAQEMGIPAKIVIDMALLFSWDIDFASRVQKGDSFSVLYEEKRRLPPTVVVPGTTTVGEVLAASFTNNGKTFWAFRYKNPEGEVGYYNKEGRELKRQFVRSPLNYTRISSGFSYSRFHPILRAFTEHRAIDYKASAGTPVSVTAKGTVVYAGWNGAYGKYVKVKHANSYATAYAHLSAIAKGVYYRARVSQNDVVGFVGSTGLSTGPHLHYEMHKNGVKINPLTLDLPPGEKMKEKYLDDFYKVRDGWLVKMNAL